MKNTFRVIAVATLVLVPACEGFKDAMTAHVDVAARAGSQQLSVQRLADLMGHAQVPVRKEVAQTIADVWVNYQLLGKAAAANDSLKDTTLIDKVMWPALEGSRRNKWFTIVSAKWKTDTSNLEQHYAADPRILSASHILFAVPANATNKQAVSDSVKRVAESVLRQTTPANFGAMAKKYSADPGSKDRGGNLGTFGPGMMVPEFETAVKSLKPGQISPLVKTQFGYHIIMRNSYASAKDAYRTAHDSLERFTNESTYVAAVEKAGNVQVKAGAPKVVKEAAADPDAHASDKTVLATSVAGDFTVARMIRWLQGQAQSDQFRQQLQQAPDTLIPNFVKFLVREQLFLRQADSAKVTLDASEIASIRQAFRFMVTSAWSGLHVAPEMLKDSAKTEGDREHLAATRVDAFLDRLLKQQEQFVDVQPPLATALREKYDGKANSAGLDRAVQAAQQIRAKDDSTRAAQEPKSAVPMPSVPDTPKPATKAPASSKKG